MLPTPTTGPWSRCFSIALLLCCALTPWSVAAQDEPTLLAVSCDIESPLFNDDLDDSDATADALCNELLTVLKRYYPFLNWKVEQDEALPHRLRMVLAETASVPLPTITLQFHGMIDGQALGSGAGDTGFAEIAIYGRLDPRNYFDDKGLRSTVKTDLEHHFGVDSSRQAFHQSFLRAVPVTSNVLPSLEDKRIIVPVSWDLLRADSDSVLRVDLKVGEGIVRPGLMKLSHVTRRHREPGTGAVQATIILFDYPPEASNHTEPWHQAIAPLFDQPVRSEVFMLEFVENLRPATDGNLSLRPE